MGLCDRALYILWKLAKDCTQFGERSEYLKMRGYFKFSGYALYGTHKKIPFVQIEIRAFSDKPIRVLNCEAVASYFVLALLVDEIQMLLSLHSSTLLSWCRYY